METTKDTTVTAPQWGARPGTLLDCRQVAAILRVHPRTVQKMAREGELSSIRIGRLWRFVPDSVDRWVHEHDVAA